MYERGEGREGGREGGRTRRRLDVNDHRWLVLHLMLPPHLSVRKIKYP